MDYAFEQIFDIPTLTSLLENFTKINGTVTALVDLDGKVHISTGWQDICTKFHRVNAGTSKRCTQSDTALAGQLAEGEKYNVYQCQNGLVDVAVPVIVAGEHVGNFFTGQFLFEKPDHNYFKKQAREFGIDEIPYFEVLDQVPVFTEQQVKKAMDFLVNLTQFIGEVGKQKLDQFNKEKEQLKTLEQEVILRTRELAQAKQKLEILAAQDSLTELDNRRQFNERFKSEYSRAKRYNKSLSVVMLDADFFKTINDKYGHATGDSVLKSIADKLKASTRLSDIIARVGGEEFCLVFPETPRKEVMSLLERIRQDIGAIEYRVNTEKFSVTCSFGVSHLNSEIESEEELLGHADKALYLAKEEGRNKIVEYRTSH